jgi:hypothetical protein
MVDRVSFYSVLCNTKLMAQENPLKPSSGACRLRRIQKSGVLLFAGNADPFLHLIEVFGEGAAAGRGEAIFGAGDAAFEELYAGNVLGFFELAGVDAEIAVGGFEHALKVVEAEGIVSGEGADDAEADALVNQAIELGEFGGDGGVVASWFAMLFPMLRPRLGGLAAGWKRSSHRAS